MSGEYSEFGINEGPTPKNLQRIFQGTISRRWVRLCTHNLLTVHDIEHIHALAPSTGLIICSNHRSFFDMYVVSSVLRNLHIPWMRDLYFPVRSEFFYERWLGFAINMAISGGAMYPPIFRDQSKRGLNRLSVEKVVEFLQRPGTVVGMHPEGKRGKGPDPYELLPAQPGIGQMALQADVPVVPIWIGGMSSDFVQQVLANYRIGRRPGQRIDIRFGSPVDLSEFRGKKPRVALYKRAADRILGAIAELGELERDAARERAAS
jgi:1-acyl-sn-glycerol-3-phosphate acyltransferase